ncbi:MAG: glycosyltransferase N-terminal domain-containing protein [Rikenellaceae bacterium]
MWLYNIAIVLYTAAIGVASLWVKKAKLWRDGRKNIFGRMAETIAPNDRIFWIHASSVGEFEQGRPIIEKVREEHPEYKILLTFFSPSGYELRKNYQGADYIFYLPVDTPSSVRNFLKIAHPEIAVFVKYEFWLNMLFELRRQNIDTYIVSAIFRRNSIFFRWYGELWRRALKSFKIIFVQNEDSKLLLEEIGIQSGVVAGDTRFDRVARIAQEVKHNQYIEKFQGNLPLMVAGSTWPPDEALLIKLIEQNRGIKFVVAPHEIDSNRIAELESIFSSAIRYTQITPETQLEDVQVLILDTMGQLSSIYRYASWAYIGGGFGVGIHNTLEASTFGLPIAFGPKYHKFKEARDMVQLGSCCSVANAKELEEWFTPLRDDDKLREKVSQISHRYTLGNQGASTIISENIFE